MQKSQPQLQQPKNQPSSKPPPPNQPPPKPPPPLRVFVSYGHDEYMGFAKNVANELKARDHEVWFDEERLKDGTEWERYIEEGLEWVGEDKSRGRILLIMTPHSVRRPKGYCLNEIAKALDNSMQIVPVMLVWATPPLSIYRLQYLDLQNSDNKLHITDTLVHDFEKICKALENESFLNETGVTNALSNQLEPLDFSADLRNNIAYYTGREWVKERINQWLGDQDASKLFWLVGLPGTGKSAIASNLINKLPNLAAFHLCKRGDSEKASAHCLVCTIAFQLCTQLPGYRERLIQIDIQKELARCNEVALFDVLIVQPLSREQNKSNEQIVILIDGLDEASRDGKNVIAQFLGSEFKKLPEWVRLIVTSRPDAEVMLPLQAFEPWRLDTESVDNMADISSYIDKRLSGYCKHPGYAQLKKEILDKSEGVFLYVAYVCEVINKDHFAENAPAELPAGLGGIYSQYFLSRFPDEDMYEDDILPVLSILLAVYEPMTAEELQGLLDWNKRKLKKFLKAMGSMLSINSNDKVVPFHLSLYDWLLDEERSDMYFVDRVDGDQMIAKKGMTIDNRAYALKHMPQHFLNAQKYDAVVDDFNFITSKRVPAGHFLFCP
ncbi:toll/interleukin-1 receptor domain-containing protein [Puteibacter caeruleilacunae]|nr:toll/interleukin-1 receptor domain-containing protein [Puteibacter caeruleilacunae]